MLGPLVSFPDPQLVAQVAEAEAPRPAGIVVFSWAKSIAFALLFALAGGAIYAAVVIASDRQIGLVAIVIGLAAGIGAARGGRGRNAQIVGACAAAVGYFGGLVMAVVWIAGTKVPIEAIGKLVWILIRETFSSMGVLFLAIAVYEGWKIPRAPQ